MEIIVISLIHFTRSLGVHQLNIDKNKNRWELPIKNGQLLSTMCRKSNRNDQIFDSFEKRVSYNKATNRKGELLDETINLR